MIRAFGARFGVGDLPSNQGATKFQNVICLRGVATIVKNLARTAQYSEVSMMRAADQGGELS